MDFTQLKCTEHAGQNCCNFCETCNYLVCSLCTSKTHKKHSLVEIKKEYNIKVAKIERNQEKFRYGIEDMSKAQSKLNLTKDMENSSYNESKHDIENYEIQLIEMVKSHIQDLTNDLDQKRKVIIKSIDEEEKKVIAAKDELLKQNDEVNEIINSTDIKRVFSTDSIESTIIPVNTTFNHVPKFVPADMENIREIHGKLEQTARPSTPDTKSVQEFNTNLIGVECFAVCSNGSFWITDKTEKVLKKVAPAGDKLKTKSKLSLEVKDIALSPSGDLFLCVAGSAVVMSLGKKKTKNSPYNLSPLEPVAIYVTDDKTVIIAAVDPGLCFPVTRPRKVVVYVLDQSGQQKNVYQFDKQNKPMFTCPIRVTSTNFNRIGIVDQLSLEGQGRVVLLWGYAISIYKGQPGRNTTFKPKDIKGTKSDNFVVAEPNVHTLHIISNTAEVLKCINSQTQLKIELPLSLSFTQTGKLYIGCDTKIYSEKKAKIYKIENFEL